MAERIELSITGLSHDGRGVGRYKGRAVFVAGAVPNEQVIACVVEKKRRFWQAKLEQILTPSPERTTPFCEHYGRCGGCQLQHLAPSAQRQWKQHNLLANLKRIWADTDFAVLPLLTGAETGYRRRARFHAVRLPTTTVAGFRRWKSHTIEDISTCPLLENALNTAWAEKRQQLLQHPPQKPIQITGVAADNGLYWSDEKATSAPYYILNGLQLYFHPQSFIQVNRQVNEQMVTQALNWLALNSSDQALDLFCGIGNFTLPMAQQAGQVIGVEGVSQAVALARHNAQANGLNNTVFHLANLFEDPTQHAWAQLPYTKVLLDPGRDGAQTVCRWLKPMPLQRLVYVSCNPATFTRDSALLKENGWRLNTLQLLDMFPHTIHAELIALFLPA
ncbi:MAG TPA: 23S rRNA (uracil(1939)-C(5))-methyltransferase RlmD [Piscirickettsiaceae bacterium]|nr:23S rRNA (uracil(1939)-C(5))-methyltransferase RlmD [Piscirickettsiaceae bacterium]